MRTGRIVAVSRGNLDGAGTWNFADTFTGTRSEYLWQVRLRKRWIRTQVPLGRSLFRLIHD
jgi:hypothetical protein